MKILFVTNMFPDATDPARGIFVKEQVEDLGGMGGLQHDVYVINGRRGYWAYVKSMMEIPRRVRRNGYDVVHIHYGLSGLFLLLRAPAATVFLTLHGSDILAAGGKPIQVFLTKKILRKVDRVFVVSGQMERVVQAHTDRCELLPCGVDVGFFKPSTFSRSRESGRLVVFPNSPRRTVKNYPLFEHAVEHAVRQASFEISTACIEGMSRAEVRDLLARADCLLMTSTSEGSPQVVKEALACGTPVVSVPVGDVPTLLEGVPCCHVSQGMEDAAELARLLLECLGGELDRGSVRQAFIDKGRYDREVVAAQLMKRYAQALAPDA